MSGEESATPRSLIGTLLETNRLETLTNRAAELLQNPILLCDTSYHILMASDLHHVEDGSWLAGIKRGHWTYEFVAKIHAMGIDRLSGGDRGRPVLIEGVTALRRRLTKLAVDGVDVGYYIVLESNVPFEAVPEEHYRLVAGVLGKGMSIERGHRGRATGRSCEDVLLDLLHADFPDRQLFLERIQGSELDRSTEFRLFVIDMAHYHRSEAQAETLKGALGRFLPFSWSVYHGENIVVLADFGHKLYRSTPQFLDPLRAFLASSGIRAGLSSQFQDLFRLPDYAAQGLAALHFGALTQDGRSLIPYEDYSQFQAIEDLAGRRDISFYCSEAVLNIARCDQERGTVYLPTLFHYLHTGRSVLATAQSMHLHRNTINYRLERIRERFGIAFDDPARNYRYYFSALAILQRSGYRFPQTIGTGGACQ